MKPSILLVEDNTELASTIVDYFESAGYLIDYAQTAEMALNSLKNDMFDIVILDLTLPGMSGLELCQLIRSNETKVIPVLMLTALSSLEDTVRGFNYGADDYVKKPFALRELEVRVCALSRRHSLKEGHVIELPPLKVDRLKRSVFRDEHYIGCTKMGFNIINILAEAFPRVVSRKELVNKLWGDDLTESDALRSHIYQLRLCLDKPFNYPILKTVHSVGYTFQHISFQASAE
tara:strand:+ start:617 stop:1315 length:699 start_codon:yes stop_codon:yes gene_type:complete